MNLIKAQDLITHVGDLARPKTIQERRIAAFWTSVVLVGLLALYYYLYLS